MMSESILREKSYAFALRIVKLSQYLVDEKREFVLSRKVLDSGTAIGVFIEEARQGSDRDDFGLKLSVANKEAFKTNFWIRLLRDSEYIAGNHAESLLDDCIQLQKMLVSSLKSTRSPA